MQTYVLTTNQLIEAIVRGAIAMGVIPDIEDPPTFKPEMLALYEFSQVANGGVLTFGARVLITEPVADGQHRAEAAKTSDKLVLRVKEALAGVMERPPGLSTIRSWDAKQLKQALKWARNPETTDSSNRPDFIQERARRGSRTDPAPPLDQNGSAAAPGASVVTSNGSNGSQVQANGTASKKAPRSSKADKAASTDNSDDAGGGSAANFFDSADTD